MEVYQKIRENLSYGLDSQTLLFIENEKNEIRFYFYDACEIKDALFYAPLGITKFDGVYILMFDMKKKLKNPNQYIYWIEPFFKGRKLCEHGRPELEARIIYNRKTNNYKTVMHGVFYYYIFKIKYPEVKEMKLLNK